MGREGLNMRAAASISYRVILAEPCLADGLVQTSGVLAFTLRKFDFL